MIFVRLSLAFALLLSAASNAHAISAYELGKCVFRNLAYDTTKTYYEATDPNSMILHNEGREDSAVFAKASLDKYGNVSLFLSTKIQGYDRNGNFVTYRSPELRGKEQFDAILRHFEGRVHGIYGKWISQKEPFMRVDDNLDRFNQLTARNPPLSMEQAALQTWTGQQAARHGYTQVIVQSYEGQRGRYSMVKVLFVKPEGRTR